MIELKIRLFLFGIMFLTLVSIAFAEESNVTTELNITMNETANISEGINITQNQSVAENVSDEVVNVSSEQNETAPQENAPISDFTITSFVPKEFKTGDVQFNIQVQNIGTVELSSLAAFVTGKGFSTYDVIPIDTLKPGEKSYILVMGNIVKDGIADTIQLTMRINSKVFYQNITVLGSSSGNKLHELEQVEQKKTEALSNLNLQLDEMKRQYDAFEKELKVKAESRYDVSDINAGDFKNYMRDARSSFLHKDVEQTTVSTNLAAAEYADLKKKLDDAEVIKSSFMGVIKENAVLISTIAGAMIAIFSLFEILKNKKDSLYKKIKEVRVDDNTRIVVEKKKKKGKEEEHKSSGASDQKK